MPLIKVVSSPLFVLETAQVIIDCCNLHWRLNEEVCIKDSARF
jgi:hypothetical protein